MTSYFSTPTRFGTFRFLPKLHKDKFSLRPIINYKYHLTFYLCSLIDFILRPFVIQCDSYIKDSQDLIIKTQSLKLTKDHKLYSCDFESLYTNIVHSDCINLLCDFLKDKIDNEHLNIFAFKDFLNFILNNNYFTFNETIYKQNKGIAMGSACGPSIANLFVHIYEKKWLSIHRPLAYFRFIDDIFIISLLNRLEMANSFINAFGSLKLNIVSNLTVNFLDLDISFDPITSSLDFSLYTKPTNTFSYLYILSNHPSFMFKNIIKSLYIRIRRICTKFSNFIFFSSRLSKQLQKRGYDRTLIDNIFTMVSKLNRSDLLIYKKRTPLDFNDIFIFKYDFDFNIQNFNDIIYTSFSNLKVACPSLHNTNIKVVNKMQHNILSLFVHNFKFNKNITCQYKKCNQSDCNLCIFANTQKYIQLKNNFTLPILNFGNCSSKYVIYIIHCKFCSAFYIGQTKDINQRIKSHLRNIKNFVPYHESNTAVSLHFNIKPHSFKHHFSFFILHVDNVDNLEKRLNNEAFIINLFVKCDNTVMNEYIPPIKSYSLANN